MADESEDSEWDPYDSSEKTPPTETADWPNTRYEFTYELEEEERGYVYTEDEAEARERIERVLGNIYESVDMSAVEIEEVES